MVAIEMSTKEVSAILKASLGGELSQGEKEKLAIVVLKYRQALGEVF